jgi:hypothetical protein
MLREGLYWVVVGRCLIRLNGGWLTGRARCRRCSWFFLREDLVVCLPFVVTPISILNRVIVIMLLWFDYCGELSKNTGYR